MNCTQVRQLLPEFAYHDLHAGQLEPMKEHLSRCQACVNELASLQELERMLDGVSPPPVNVNVSLLFHQAREIQSRQMRRWRRAALALAGLAAAVLFVLVLRLELRVGANQVVIGWGSKSATTDINTDPKSDSHLMPPPPSSSLAASEAELQPLRGLIYELAANLEQVSQESDLRDRRQQQNLNRIQDQVTQLRMMFQRHMTTYLADSSKKGDNR
ncbi:MAG TPA: zf-HC2 domain-containing protein [Gemmataceae bacterium]|jgi:hypothetical protein|nr:zf-HC2 domain-containing protein [Gemmataceae bacterium]